MIEIFGIVYKEREAEVDLSYLGADQKIMKEFVYQKHFDSPVPFPGVSAALNYLETNGYEIISVVHRPLPAIVACPQQNDWAYEIFTRRSS